MKKILMGSTALAVAGLIAGPAVAQTAGKITLGLGGYMEQWVGYTDNDDIPAGTDLSGIETNSDTEIFFLGKTVTDNGLEFGVNVQLEGNTSGDQIDESFLYVEGSFGRLQLGSENSAQYLMQYNAPEVGIELNSGDQTAWVSFAGVGGTAGIFRGAFGATFVETGRQNDVNRITYFTPRFSGFQFGASYTPTNEEDGFGGVFDRNAGVHDTFSFGANFVESFNGVDVAVAGGYGFGENDTAGAPGDPQAWSAGLNIGFAGFTVGGSYAHSDDDPGTGGDMDGFDVGASYGTGPWAVSLTWFRGERDEGFAGGPLEAEMNSVHLSSSYKLGPGITLAGTVGYTDLQDDSGAGVDNEAVYVVAGPKLKF